MPPDTVLPDVGRDLGLERVVFFSDAVFAIVITLLVLPVAVDVDLATAGDDLGGLLDELTPRLVAFAISFLVVGQFWMAHHRTFGLIHAVDRTLLWLNLLALMAISFLPFPTALLGAQGSDEGAAVAFYAASLTVAASLALLVWVHAQRAGLVAPGVGTAARRAHTRRSVVSTAVFALSVPVGLAGLVPAVLCWVLLLPLARLAATRLPAGQRH